MNIPQSSDLTRNAFAENRITDDFRPLAAQNFPAGTVLQFVAQDFQVYPDYRTVQPSPAVVSQFLLAGVVAEEMAGSNYGGFDALGGTTSASSAARGNQIVPATIYGYHSGILIDNTAGNTITNGTPLTTSATQVGRAQGISAPVASAILGNAALPSTGVGSSLTGAAQVQPTQTITIAGTPATNDVYTVTLQVPYSQASPGVVQTRTITITLTAGQAASVTTAAAAVVAAITGDAVLGKYYTATNAAGVVTVTPLAAALFAIYFANAYNNVSAPSTFVGFQISLSGSAGNGLTIAAAKTSGGGTVTAGGATFAGGTGFIGKCPVWITLL